MGNKVGTIRNPKRNAKGPRRNCAMVNAPARSLDVASILEATGLVPIACITVRTVDTIPISAMCSENKHKPCRANTTRRKAPAKRTTVRKRNLQQ